MKKDIFISNLKKSSVILTAALVISGFFVANFALAVEGATITPASGGSNISIDTTSAEGGSETFKSLSGPSITENTPGAISVGIHTINLPNGWEFDTESSVIVIRTVGNIEPETQPAVLTANTLTFEIDQVSTENSGLAFIMNSMRVRPTGTTPSTGNMTYSGVGINGVVVGEEGTNFGTLTTVAGTVTQLAFYTQPGDAVYGSILNLQPVIETQDQFGNHSTSGLATNLDVTLTLSGTGALHGDNILDIGINGGDGVVTFTDLTVDSVGVDNTLVASATGLTSVESEHFTITPAPLIITADAQIKIYGAVNPALTVSYDGLVGGDTDAVVSGLSVTTLADTATPAGTVDIIVSGATAANYSISFVPGVLTITQAPLTITAYAQTKVYGEVDPELTYVTVPDPLLNEDILTGSLSRDGGENVGTYAITLGDLNNSNYEITFVSADFTISKKALTVTAVTDTKIYDGDATSAAIPTTGSLAFEDTAGFVQTYDNKNVGEAKTLTPSGVVNDGNGGLNYSYSFVVDTAGTITQAPLTITAENKTKVYGTANPSLTASYDGLVGDDTSEVVSGLSIETVANTTTPAGTVAITPSGATAANYSITFNNGTLAITQAPLTITADVQTKVYGEIDPALTYVTIPDPLINEDVLTGSLSRDEGENVGTYAITIGDLNNSNYNITFVSDNLTINKKALTVTAVTDTKTYDGDTTSDAMPIITESLEFSDTADFLQTYDNKNVGTGKTLTPSGVVIDSNGGLNYSYIYNTDLTGVITQASLTATVTVSNKVVDGDNSATITDRTLIGVIGDDIVIPNEDGTATFADANIGNDKEVTATGITITGDDTGNYSYNGEATGTGNILSVPTIVYVNDDWTEVEPWTDPDGMGPATYFGYDAFAIIQEGINAVEENGTINVAAGTYTKQINIEKSLTITGAGQDNTHIVSPDPTTMAIYDLFGSEAGVDKRYIGHRGANIPVVRIAASTVTFEGFHIDLGNQVFWHVQGSFGLDYSKGVGILVDHVETIPGTPDTFTGITIENNKIDGLLWNDYGDGVKVLGNATVIINNNTIYGYGESAISAQGMDTPRAAFYPTVTANDNTIYGGSNAREGNHFFFGVGYWSGATGSTDGNTIYNAPNDNGYALNSWTPNQVSFTNNVITTDGGSVGGYGAQLYESSNLVFSNNDIEKQALVGVIWKGGGTGIIITITNNEITNCVDGFIGDGLTAGSVTLHDNNFVDCTFDHFALDMAGNDDSIWGESEPCTITADATENYWGTAVAATIESKISGSVDYDPYYVDSAMMILSSTVPVNIYIDDDYTDGSAGGHYFGYDAFTTIQEGIDAVASAGTVNVAAGIYTESLEINKGVTLQGADRDVVTVTGTHTIIANNVVIDGFTLQGTGSNVITIDDTIARSGGTISNNRITGGYDGIRVGTGGAGVDHITIEKNIIIDNSQKGIRFWSGADYETHDIAYITIDDNEITNSGSSGISTYGNGPNTIINNTVSNNGGNGISIKYDDGDIISGNIVTGNDAMGINMHEVTNTLVENNTVSGHLSEDIVTTFWGDSITAGKGSAIYVHEASQNNTIRLNGLMGNKIGVLINREAAGDDPSGNSINNNEITSNTEYGIQNALVDPPTPVDAEANWWGSIEGPTHVDNLFGDGDVVTNHVDYSPWRITDVLTDLVDDIAPTAVLSGTPAVHSSLTTASITIGGDGVVYYKYKLDAGAYSEETAVATPIALADLSESSHIIDVLGRDQAGNWQSVATTYTWNVDVTIPTLTSVVITSDNGNGATLAKVGDIITLTIVAYENIQEPTVTIAGSSANVSGLNDSWTATYTMAGGDTEGPVAFAINFTDLAGNPGDIVTSVTDGGGSVAFDKTAPAVILISIAGNEYINDSEKGAIHVIGTAEADSTVNVSLTSGVTVSGSGTATGGNYDITIDGTTLTDGTITPSVTATDAVGNTSSALVIPTAVKDIVAPTVISHTPGINAINVESGVVTITFSENIIVETGDITFSPSATFVISGSGTEIVTLTPDSILNSNTVYTITVTTNTTDEAGNGLAEAYDWQFTTATLYDIALNANNGGWNLISLPVVPNHADISTVLGDAESNIQAVWTYDPLHPNAIGGWLVYVPGNSPEINNISTMTAGYGYWISVTGDTHISGSGGLLSAGPTTPPSRNLTTGWNLVGYYQIPGEDSSVPANAFASLGGTAGLSALYGFNNSFGSFVDVTTILPGDAFWISLPSEKIYTPSNIGSN